MDKVWYVTRRSYMSSKESNKGFFKTEDAALRRRDELERDGDYTQIAEVHGPYHVE